MEGKSHRGVLPLLKGRKASREKRRLNMAQRRSTRREPAKRTFLALPKAIGRRTLPGFSKKRYRKPLAQILAGPAAVKSRKETGGEHRKGKLCAPRWKGNGLRLKTPRGFSPPTGGKTTQEHRRTNKNAPDQQLGRSLHRPA